MADVELTYKGSKISELSSTGTKIIKTKGKYCEDNISVNYTKPSTPSTDTQTKTVTPTASGFTVNPDTGYLLSSVVLNGDSDLIPSNVKEGVNIFGVVGTLNERQHGFVSMVNVVSDIKSAVKIMDLDATVLNHVNDDSFTVSVIYAGEYTVSASRVMTMCGNRSFAGSYGIVGQVASSTATKITPSTISYKVNSASNPQIRALTTGLYLVGASATPYLSGNYIVSISW